MKYKRQKIYNVNNGGKMVLVNAYSKKQIGEHFRMSAHELTNYCSETSHIMAHYLGDDENGIIDLTVSQKDL